MAFRPGCAGMDVQFAEISAQPLVGVDVQRLVAKEQNLVLRQRLMQLLDLAVAERLRQRDAFDVGADARRYWRDADGFIAHGTTFRWQAHGSPMQEQLIPTVTVLRSGSSMQT